MLIKNITRRTLRQLRQGLIFKTLKKQLQYLFWFGYEKEVRQTFLLEDEAACYQSVEQPLEPVHVPVKHITHMVAPKVKQIYSKKYHFDFQFIYRNGFKSRVAGMILGGNWDLATEHFDGYNDFTAFKERFIEGKKWEDTYYYRSFKKRNNNKMMECNDFQEYKERYLFKWDQIFSEIKNSGYKSQSEMGGYLDDEVQVCVSRDGQLLFRDGKHRVFIAKMLQLDEIPVIVNVWHRAFLDEVAGNSEQNIITPRIATRYLLDKHGNKD